MMTMTHMTHVNGYVDSAPVRRKRGLAETHLLNFPYPCSADRHTCGKQSISSDARNLVLSCYSTAGPVDIKLLPLPVAGAWRGEARLPAQRPERPSLRERPSNVL